MPLYTGQREKNNTTKIHELIPHLCGHYTISLIIFKFLHIILQCFDAVGWAAGRASGL